LRRTNPETVRTEAVTIPRRTFEILDELLVDTIVRLATSPSPDLQQKSIDLQAALGDMRCEIARFDLAVELWGPTAKRPEPEAKAPAEVAIAAPLHFLQRSAETDGGDPS